MVRKKHQKMSMLQNSCSFFLPLESVLNILFLSSFFSFSFFFIQNATTICVNEHVVQIP